jgi:hypothetical protein
LREVRIGGIITLKWVLKEEIDCEGVDWVQLGQDRVKWRALVNTVMNILDR